MNLSRFLIIALVFFIIGTVILYTGTNRASFRKVPADNQHKPGHTSQVQEDLSVNLIC
jgi:hypothetical protein